MGSIRIDTSQWPLVIHEVEGHLSDEQVDAYIAEGTAILDRCELHATVIDATRLGAPTAYMRGRSAEWQRSFRPQLQAHSAGTAFVLPSPLLRFVAMTVLFVTHLPTEYAICATREEGIAWARARLEAEALKRPQRGRE